MSHYFASARFPAAASPAGRVSRPIRTGQQAAARARPGRPGAGRSGRAAGGLRPVYCPGGRWRASGAPGRRSAGAADLEALAGCWRPPARPGEGRAGRRIWRALAGSAGAAGSGRDPGKVTYLVNARGEGRGRAIRRDPRHSSAGGRGDLAAAIWRPRPSACGGLLAGLLAAIRRGRDLAAGGSGRRRCG